MSTAAISTSNLLSTNNSLSSSSSSSTSGSGVNSSTALGSGSTSPLTLVGVSNYSSDLQSVLNRAVQIADIPVQELQNEQQTAMSKKAGLITLNTDIQNFTNALTSLGTLA